MNFEINGLLIGAGTMYELESPVEGLDTPDIRTSSNNYSGRDGGIIAGQFYSPRLITLTGFVHNYLCDDQSEARKNFQAALPIREDLDLIITTFTGEQYTTTVRVVDVQLPITDKKISNFKVDLYASDPNLYEIAGFELIIPRTSGGGFILPVVVPIIFEEGGGITNVPNNGSTVIYPTFKIVGSATNPIFTNVDTGEVVQVNITTGPGDELLIDMKNRTITLNGSSVLGYRTDDSSWFGLKVGVNKITYNTDTADDTGQATVKWQNAIQAL